LLHRHEDTRRTSVRPTHILIASLITATALSAAACGSVSHIGEYKPKQRDYQSPVDLTATKNDSTNGSLFASSAPAAYLYADQRAMHIGDIVTINVSEEADAKRGAVTDLTRSASVDLQISKFLGLIKLLGDTINNGDLIAAGQGSDFYGAGETSRTEHVRATVPALVKQVLPNGNLFIEGHRVILVNEEEHHFYVSGVVRPVDIQDDNSVDSGRIADAEIEFTGRGVVSEKQRPGWLQRGLDLIAPF